MAKKKYKDVDGKMREYCPLSSVPVVENLPDKPVYLARNLWVNKDKWIVRYYHEGEMHVEEYANREDILSRWPESMWYKPETIA